MQPLAAELLVRELLSIKYCNIVQQNHLNTLVETIAIPVYNQIVDTQIKCDTVLR